MYASFRINVAWQVMMVIRVCDKFIDSDAGINMASKEGNAISKIYFFFSEDNSYPQTLFIMIEGT